MPVRCKILSKKRHYGYRKSRNYTLLRLYLLLIAIPQVQILNSMQVFDDIRSLRQREVKFTRKGRPKLVCFILYNRHKLHVMCELRVHWSPVFWYLRRIKMDRDAIPVWKQDKTNRSTWCQICKPSIVLLNALRCFCYVAFITLNLHIGRIQLCR